MSNWDKIKKAISTKNMGTYAEIEKVIKLCIQEMYSWLDSNYKEWENDTYNLLDSTGVGVYKDGVLIELVPLAAQRATKPRTITYHRQKKSVDGRALLIEAINNKNVKGSHYTFVLFSTADYAKAVEQGGDSGGNRGKDWFKKLSEYMKGFIEKQLV